MRSFPAIRLEGGLLGPDTIEQIMSGDLPGQKPADFGLDGRRSITDEIAAAFADSRRLWEVFQHRLQRLAEDDLGTSVTRDAWMIPFLGLFGIEPRYNHRAYEVDGMTFAISHRMGETEDAPPVHIVGARQDLGRLAPSGRPRLAPHSLVQEFLKRTEHVWGIVTNGMSLRLLRDSTFIRRQAYIEFDLRSLIEEQLFNDFTLLYKLLHRTRFPRGAGDAQDCLLERYYRHSEEQGGRVREHLREGVEECIKRWAQGFLRHPRNEELRRRICSTDDDRISPEDLYRQLLRLIYRFLFLLVSEDRGLLSSHSVYRDHYGIGRLRRLLDNRSWLTDDDDLWQSLRVLWRVLADENLAKILTLPALNGQLFEEQDLDSYTISNRHLLEGFWYLTWYQERQSAPPQRVNYFALDTEELGSVYESLLEYHPQIAETSGSVQFDLLLGQERRSTGSFYTPPELVATLLDQTLEPVIKERLATAHSPHEKERAVLSIRICDPAAGSGHFLLAAARRLGKELARIRTGEDEPAPERVREATREVVTHCIYGVDKNPLAVELCRVALWLEAHAEGKPLTFLDHRICCGDSLVGIENLEILRQGIPDQAFVPVGGTDRTVAREAKRRNASERKASLFHAPFAENLARLAEPLRALENLPEDTLEQVRKKIEVSRAVEQLPEFQRLQLACDAWTAAFYQRFSDRATPALTTSALHDALSRGNIPDARLSGYVIACSVKQRFFHWPLSFPEVFAQGGFDVILGNPPFMGGLRISGNFGETYRKWLENTFAPFGGTADLCAAFFRRGFSLLKPGGRLGMIATNTLGQGDTRQSGLAVILQQGGAIHFAQRFVKWPGQASVEVNLVALHKLPSPDGRGAEGEGLLDSHPVPFISSRLDDQPEREPARLARNEGKAFIGSYVLGMGFSMQPEEAERLITQDPRHRDCLFPYLNGEDLNSHPEQQPSRWVINFFDWDLERAREYPNLIQIVEERVKPEREKLRDSIPTQARRKKFWWQYGSAATQLYQAIVPLRRVLARSRVSELHSIAFVRNDYIYSDATIVFAFDDDYHFALLQSAVHETWLRKQASSLRTDIRYTPTDCFDTFPFPPAEYAAPSLAELLAQPPFAQAAHIGGAYHEHRRQVMRARGLGLTKTYNLFHNPACADEDIHKLRELHAALDNAILACYGWEDLELRHDFYQNERGQTRFMPSAEARREMVFRLMALNEKMKEEEKL